MTDEAAPSTALVKTYQSEQPYILARKLYFEYSTLADISRATGLTTRVIKKWRNDEGWDDEREDDTRGLLEASFGSRKVTIAKIIKTAPEILYRGLEHLAKRVDPLTLDEAVKVSAIIANLDKISRLDSGKATENVNLQVGGKIAMSADEIRKVLASDPFFTEIAPKSGDE